MEKNEQLVLTVAQLSERLQLGLSSCYMLCKSKDFPCAKVGKKLLIPVDGLEKWLSEKSTKNCN